MFAGRLKYRIDRVGAICYGVVMLDDTDIAEEQVLESDRAHTLKSLCRTVESVLSKQLALKGASINT